MKIIRPTAIRDSGGSFTRASPATYYDSAGVLQTAAVNIPRIGYDPVTHVHTGLVYEAAATNLLTYSEQFDNAIWVKTNATINATGAVAPDGTSTADKAIEDSSVTASHIPYRRTYTSTISTYTHSIFVKAVERSSFMLLAMRGDGVAIFSADFDLVGGTAISRSTSMSGSSFITALGNSWFRCSITYSDTTGGAGAYVDMRLSDSPISSATTGDSYTGNGTSGLYIWGGQLEVGSLPTSYIQTPSSSTVTRAADVAAGTGFLYTNVPEAPVTLLTKPEKFITQNVTVTAQSYVLSFYGTGLLTLSNAYSGTLSGTGTANRVYLVFTPTAGTLTITLSSADGSVINSQLEVGSVLGPYINEAPWNSGTTYVTSQRVSRVTTGTHKIYQSVSGGLSSVPPENAPTLWAEISATNRWQAFDETISTSTKYLNSVTYLVKPGRINSLAVLGVSASDISISLIDPSNGQVVYASSADLNNGVNVGDWYQYFYEPIYQQEAVAITNLLDAVQLEIYGYGEAVLAVTFNYPNNIVEVGALVVGLSAELGSTQNAPTVGIIDYSKKDTDIYGNTTILVRRFSKRVSAKVMFKSALTDNINQILSQYRSTPLVWVGADNLYTSLIVYGFYRDYDITIDNIIMSSCNLTIEGLT